MTHKFGKISICHTSLTKSRFLNQTMNVMIGCIEVQCIPKNGIHFCPYCDCEYALGGIFSKYQHRYHFEDDGYG